MLGRKENSVQRFRGSTSGHLLGRLLWVSKRGGEVHRCGIALRKPAGYYFTEGRGEGSSEERRRNGQPWKGYRLLST